MASSVNECSLMCLPFHRPACLRPACLPPCLPPCLPACLPAGMGESYMDGDYEVDDLGAMLAVATANANNIEVGGRAGG